MCDDWKLIRGYGGNVYRRLNKMPAICCFAKPLMHSGCTSICSKAKGHFFYGGKQVVTLV